MTVTSDPPGAIVWMNDQEIGRTPIQRDFTWYGTYEVQVRAEGYQTLNTKTPVIAPWWQWPPIDFFVEFIPGLKDERSISYKLEPVPEQPMEASELIARAQEMRGKLEMSEFAPPPTTAPATRAIRPTAE
jgi:hypothetical protein